MAASCPSAQAWKLTFRVLGACASIAFMLQDIWILQEPQLESLWRFCNWLGQALLFLLAGAAGLCLELRGGVASVAAHSARFAFNRISLTLFYFWLGCYVQGFDAGGLGQEVLARITGILAWVVCIGDLFIACLGAKEELHVDEEAPAERSLATVPGEPQAAEPSAPAEQSPAPSEEAENPDPAPVVNWNTACSQPFGAASAPSA